MKSTHLLTGLSLAAALVTNSQAVTTNWIANAGSFTGNWTSTNNWNAGVPGIDTIANATVKINNSAADVTVNSAITGGTPIQQFEMQEGTLNIQAGADLEVGDNNKDFRTGSAGGTTINQSGGDFTVKHQFQLARTGDTDYNLSGGTLDYVGDSGSGRVMRYYDGANLNVTTTGVVNNLGSAGSGVGAPLGIDNGTTTIGLADMAQFNSTAQYRMNFGSGTIDHSFTMNGSGVTASFGSINAFVQAAASTATLRFITDATGVSPINVSGQLDLSGGDHAADLFIDLTNYAGASDIVLIDYGTLSGVAFDNVTIVGGVGTIDYDFNGLGQVVLTIPIPEPSSAILLAVAAFGLGCKRRR